MDTPPFSSSRRRPPAPALRTWLLSAAGSLLVNVGAIVSIVCATAGGRASLQASLARAVAPAPEPLTVLTPVLEAFRPEPLPEDDPAANPPKALETTAPSQASATPPDRPTPFVGERNTRASSNAPPSPGAPALPSLKGRPAPDDKPSTFDSRFQEGEQDDRSGASVPIPEAAPPVMPPSLAETAPQPPPSRVPSGTLPVERATLRQDPAPATPPPPLATLVPEEKTQPKKEEGYVTEAERLRMEGSLANEGEGSLDVQDTPDARYRTAVKKAVESHWRTVRAKNAQYLVSGIVRVSILIDPPGKIRTTKFENEFGASQFQKGLLIGSIHETTLPAMPADVSKELGGEPLAVPISFIFSDR